MASLAPFAEGYCGNVQKLKFIRSATIAIGTKKDNDVRSNIKEKKEEVERLS